MKTFQKITSLSFLVALFMVLGFNANAQTTNVTIVNNSACDMAVSFGGDYGIIPCGSIEAGGTVFNVPAGTTTTAQFLDAKTNLPASAFLRGAGAFANEAGSTNAVENSCLSMDYAGASTCGTYSIDITITPLAQTITIN